jgi:hypothetical protein
LPEAVAETPPPRVFSGTQCKYPLHGDERPVVPRFCAEPVRDNAKGCASPYCAACDLAEKSRHGLGARVVNKQNKMEDETCR